jgi:hypothetical protein
MAIQAGERLFGAAAAGPAATPTQPQLAAENFPGGPAVGTQLSSADSIALRQPGQSPGTTNSTTSTAGQARRRQL